MTREKADRVLPLHKAMAGTGPFYSNTELYSAGKISGLTGSSLLFQ